ncbi:MAG: pilus assembly protein [Candidatus Riflebacteria bacterium]|nr:pilus assembly protein [Candidatus Riflebacteria bacterium]
MFTVRRRKGQALVEMALMAPLLFLFVMCGLVNFGFAFYRYITLQQAVNSAAMWGAEKKGTVTGTVTSYDIMGWLRSTERPPLPPWWSRSEIESIQVSVPNPLPETSDRSAKIVVVTFTFDSPLYTPFYQVLFEKINGKKAIPMVVRAAFQIPRNTLGAAYYED